MLRRIGRVRSGAEARQMLLPYLDPVGEAMILAPTRAAADELAFTVPGSFGIHRKTLLQLAAEVAAAGLAARGLTPIAGLTGDAVATRAIHDLRRERKLGYFSPVADTPGFPQAVSRTLRELRLEAITPAKLSRGSAAERDLGLLLRAWNTLLDRFSLADEAAVLELAAKADDGLLSRLPILVLDLPLRTRAERNFLAGFFDRSPSVVVAISEGDRESEAAWRTLLGVPSEEPAAIARTQLEALRERLFASAEAPAIHDDSVQCFSAPGESSECVEIARRIQALARRGVPFDQIAILLRQPERYQPLVEDGLRRAGVPAYFSRGVRRPDPGGRAFLTLLECAAESLSASRFAEYLSLAQLPAAEPDNVLHAPSQELAAALIGAPEEEPPKPDPARTPPSPAQWERLLVDAAVIGGAGRWRRRLDGLAAELRLQLNGLGEEDAQRLYVLRELDQLEHLRAFALPLIETLDSLPSHATWDDWLPRLGALARTALRNPYGVLTLLVELEPLRSVGPVSLDEVRGVLMPHLASLREEPPRRRYGCVLVAGIEEARGRAFEVAFVPGLAEGIFPQRIREDPLLLDSARERLSLDLPRRETHTARERTHLEIAAGAAISVVYSYPTMDMSLGRGRVPSLYALEVERAARGGVTSLDEFERAWRAASSARLGWPAPEDARAAIDDSEYDLAVLGNIPREAPVAAVRGALGFLTQNLHAARSLRARHRRWETKEWTISDGLVASPKKGVPEGLAGRSLTRLAYSPTSLQHWAACPYRFYLNAILHLRQREQAEAIEKLDPLTRGRIFHSVQFRIFMALRETNALPLTKATFDSSLTVADRELDLAVVEYRELLAPAIPAVWLAEIESIRTDLRGWLYDLAQDQGRWTPIHFELHFGLVPSGGSDASSTEVDASLGDFHLRGAIDLIEKETATGELRVVDHKTGRAHSPTKDVVIGGGEVLQPALYALAAEAIFKEQFSSGELYYCTHAGGYHRCAAKLNAFARNRAHQVLQSIDQAIAKGILPAAPRLDACGRCDYQIVCGPSEERRILKKPRETLRDLHFIRSLP